MLVELRRERVQLAVQRLLARSPIVRTVGTSRAIVAAVVAMVVAVLAARPAALRARSAQLGGARGLFHGQGDAAALGIHADDLDAHGLTDG